MINQLRNFVFTINNYTEEDLQSLQKLPYSYIIYGKELGENKTPHLQGYCELENRLSFTKVKKAIPRAHIEPRKGSQLSAIKYCKKEQDFTELGTRKKQGSRNDIKTITEQLTENPSIIDLLNCDMTLNYQTLRFAENYLKYVDKPRDFKPHVTWLYGESGVGKTREAVEALPDAYFKPAHTKKWWYSYDGQEDIIIDDIRPSYISLGELLNLLDRYPCVVEAKGTQRQFRGRNIYITSPKHPKDQYSEKAFEFDHGEENIKQLLRRIDEIREILPEVAA